MQHFALLFLMLLCGCGSSEVSSSLTSPPAQESVTIQRILDFIQARRDLDQDEGLVELTRFMASQSTVRGSLLADDGSVWAWLESGQLVVFANNRKLAPVAPRESAPPAPRTEFSLPVSARAHFANTFGGSPGFSSPVAVLSQLASGSGYQVSRGGEVEDLRRLTSLGTLYMDAHGASSADASNETGRTPLRGLVLRQRVPSAFSVWTATRATPTLDEDYAQELNRQSLIHFIAPVDHASYERHYGITGKFVRENWTFQPHSLVFINACSSMSEDFQSACEAVGAGAYFGWTREVSDRLAHDSASALYVRLFPSSAEPSVSTIDEAFQQLRTLQLDQDLSTGAQLRWNLLSDSDFGLLVPSLRSLQVDGGTLTLRGHFGAIVGQVLIDGSPVTLSGSWNSETLRVALPEQGTLVQVQVGGRLSNSLEIPHRDAVAPDFSLIAHGVITSHSGNSQMVGARVNLQVSIADGKVTGFYETVFPGSLWDFSAAAVGTIQNGVVSIADGTHKLSFSLPLPGQNTFTATQIARVPEEENGPLVTRTSEIFFDNFTLSL